MIRFRGMEWKGCTPVRKLTLLAACGFGLGLSPVASGTAGTLAGLVFVLGFPFESWVAQALYAALLAALAVPLCGIAEAHFGKKDDGRIVADEYLTFPICVIGLPVVDQPLLLVVAFVTHRIMDIIKPFPAFRLQSVKGGPGIVLDDVASSIYALALNHVLWAAFHRYISF